jgi:hypothetical protein
MRQLDDATFTDKFKNEVRSISTTHLYSMYQDARGHGANEACTVDVALCEKPYELPNPTIWSAKKSVNCGLLSKR